MLTLREVGRHPQGATALQELRRFYVVTEGTNGLVFTQKTGDLRLFLYNMEEVLGAARRIQDANCLRETQNGAAEPAQDEPPERRTTAPAPDPVHAAHQTIAELLQRIARLQAASKATVEEREHWKLRATRAERGLGQSASNGGDRTVGDRRYESLRRFLAKQFHPDHAPGDGIEKMIRGEMFKEIWAQIDRIDAAHR